MNCVEPHSFQNNKEETSLRIGFTHDIYETEKEETLKKKYCGWEKEWRNMSKIL